MGGMFMEFDMGMDEPKDPDWGEESKSYRKGSSKPDDFEPRQGRIDSDPYDTREKTGRLTDRERRRLPGHEKCEKLREIRKKIAEVNNIPYSPAECSHDGPCAGTCPYCDAELMYLDCELQKKKERGEEVYLSGLSIEINDIESDNYDNHEYDTRGENVNLDEDDVYGEDEDWVD